MTSLETFKGLKKSRIPRPASFVKPLPPRIFIRDEGLKRQLSWHLVVTTLAMINRRPERRTGLSPTST